MLRRNREGVDWNGQKSNARRGKRLETSEGRRALELVCPGRRLGSRILPWMTSSEVAVREKA